MSAGNAFCGRRNAVVRETIGLETKRPRQRANAVIRGLAELVRSSTDA